MAFGAPRHLPRRAQRIAFAAVALALAGAPRSSRSQPAPSGQPGPGSSPDAATDAYRQHMDNGVKLYQDKNYAAAIAEFDAAYKLRPRASPLVNISLCQKGLFNYPKAIAALETALGKHADSMSEADKSAAAETVKDMRALLAQVTIELSPANATVSVDGEDLAASATARPIPLGPSTWAPASACT